MKQRHLLAMMVAVLVMSGAALAQGLAQFPRGVLEVVTAAGARHSLQIELAVSPEQLSQGLMYRKTLPPDGGMLFDFGRVKPVSMWMRNTLIPLDMVFIAADGRIAGIAERTVPMSEEIISSPGPVRAVLELNSGAASRLGLNTGDRVLHPMFASTSK